MICLILGLGEHKSGVIPPGGIPSEETVITSQPNVNPETGCDSPFQLAQVTSGTPPDPLEMDDYLCARLVGG